MLQDGMNINGLENRPAFTGSGGSNPSPSATNKQIAHGHFTESATRIKNGSE